MRTFYAAFVALSITHATFADTTLEFDEQGSTGQPQRILIKDGKVLIRSGDGEDMLYDQRQQRVTVIDQAQRAFYVMDPEAMAAGAQAMQSQMQEQMGAAMAEMQEQIGAAMAEMMNDPDIPEAQKQMMREEMAKMAGGTGAMPGAPAAEMPAMEPMQVAATGESRKVAGISCMVYRVTQGAEVIEEACIASRKAAGVPKGDYETMRSMFAFMREVAERSMSAMGVDGGGPVFPDYDGVPVQTEDMHDGSVSTLRNVSTKKIAASVFEIPAGYQEMNPFQ